MFHINSIEVSYGKDAEIGRWERVRGCVWCEKDQFCPCFRWILIESSSVAGLLDGVFCRRCAKIGLNDHLPYFWLIFYRIPHLECLWTRCVSQCTAFWVIFEPPSQVSKWPKWPKSIKTSTKCQIWPNISLYRHVWGQFPGTGVVLVLEHQSTPSYEWP
jgi:hypothetical protein